MIKKTYTKPSLFASLGDMLDHSHPLFRLADKIEWIRFEEAFIPLYCNENGRPCKPIRLMCGLLILKHVRDISDESVVEQWSENPYYQYFCGMDEFTTSAPCSSSELVHFRHRIGEKGIELILAESIRVNDDHDDRATHKTAFIDSTVQEKNVTFPTDSKLLKRVIEKIMKIVEDEGLPLRQSYRRTLKAIFRDQRFRNHPKNWKKARKADKKLRTIAGRLLRELQRNLGENHKYDEQINIFVRVVGQKRSDKNKIYSIHEPEVQSIVRSITGLILGALSFRNEYDGHTIEDSLKQVERLTGRKVNDLAGDRGYRGKKEVNGTRILIPDTPKADDSYYKKRKKRELFCKRAGIEPTISHIKHDFRMGRNFYKGVFGDNINVMLAAAAYNFKRAMRLLLRLVEMAIYWAKNPGTTTKSMDFATTPICL